MNRFVKSIFDLQELEQFSRRKMWINSVHPSVKILISLVYIVLLAAVEKYQLSSALLFGVYLILLISVADIPFRALGSKLIIPGVLSISLGLFNLILDREVVTAIFGIGISGGVISLLVLYVKAMFTISATLLLVSTTTIEDLGNGLVFLKVPKTLVTLLLLMYRYIVVLLNEVNRTMEAYQLRDPVGKGVNIRAWGSLVGQIMIRSYRRSEEIYNAMLLRGYKL